MYTNEVEKKKKKEEERYILNTISITLQYPKADSKNIIHERKKNLKNISIG